jgi:hypothetical protein
MVYITDEVEQIARRRRWAGVGWVAVTAGLRIKAETSERVPSRVFDRENSRVAIEVCAIPG